MTPAPDVLAVVERLEGLYAASARPSDREWFVSGTEDVAMDEQSDIVLRRAWPSPRSTANLYLAVALVEAFPALAAALRAQHAEIEEFRQLVSEAAPLSWANSGWPRGTNAAHAWELKAARLLGQPEAIAPATEGKR